MKLNKHQYDYRFDDPVEHEQDDVPDDIDNYTTRMKPGDKYPRRSRNSNQHRLNTGSRDK